MARGRGLDLLGKHEKRLSNGAHIKWDDRELQVDISKAMNSKLKTAANMVASIARQEVPVGKITRAAGKFKSWQGRKPGSLKSSIRVKKSRFKDGGWIVTVGGRDTYYWFFVHYGTHQMYPSWFMSRALHKARSRLRGRL